MKQVVIVPVIALVLATFNAMADEPYKHEYSNNGHFEGKSPSGVIAAQKEAGAAMKEGDPYTLTDNGNGEIDLDALPPTAAGVMAPKAGSASSK